MKNYYFNKDTGELIVLDTEADQIKVWKPVGGGTVRQEDPSSSAFKPVKEQKEREGKTSKEERNGRIIELTKEGLKTKDIAEKLKVSVATVAMVRSRYKKQVKKNGGFYSPQL